MRAGLHRRGVRAHHQAAVGRLQPEGVLHGARRVVRAEVERVEVQPLGLDLGALGDLPAHRDEHVADQLLEGGQRVPGALRGAVPRQRDVDGLLDQHPRLVLGLELGLPGRRAPASTAPRACADAHAGVLAGLRRQRADLPVRQRQRRAVAGVLGADPLERVEVGGGGDRGEGGLAHRLDLVRLQRGDLDGVVLGVRARHVPAVRCGSVRAQRRSLGTPDALRPPDARSLGAAVLARASRMLTRAPPAGESSISTEPPWAFDEAVDDVHAQPGAAAGAVLPELREHPAADVRADPVALVVDVQQHPVVRRLVRRSATRSA